jgi:hypothetical protein
LWLLNEVPKPHGGINHGFAKTEISRVDAIADIVRTHQVNAMELPTTQPDKSKGLRAKRRRISEERAWNYGGWAAMALFPVPYALMQPLLQNATGALLATASFLSVTAIVVLRRYCGRSLFGS